uniref:Uncharacterized protein n=1 Tax=Rhizophora mucronata TaxID=61149 RepID=A0A2P2PAD5_RHIMU
MSCKIAIKNIKKFFEFLPKCRQLNKDTKF